MNPFPSAFGNWNGRETAIRSLKCLDPPTGCGSPIQGIPFTDEQSRREYQITGMCQNCQDATYAYMYMMERHGDCTLASPCESPEDAANCPTAVPVSDHGHHSVWKTKSSRQQEVHGDDEDRQGHPAGEQPEADSVA